MMEQTALVCGVRRRRLLNVPIPGDDIVPPEGFGCGRAVWQPHVLHLRGYFPENRVMFMNSADAIPVPEDYLYLSEGWYDLAAGVLCGSCARDWNDHVRAERERILHAERLAGEAAEKKYRREHSLRGRIARRLWHA